MCWLILFSGLKVRGAGKTAALTVTRAFTEGEWGIIQNVIQNLEPSYGWEPAAAQRLRFVINRDFPLAPNF